MKDIQYMHNTALNCSPKNEAGLTLIELMISLTLGLLLSAAAMQLFLSGITVYKLQSSVNDIQDTAIFGLDFLSDHTALANLGSPIAMTDTSAWTGIVLSTSTANSAGTDTVGNLRRTKGNHSSHVTLEATGISNVASLKSDQLVIQFRAPYDSFTDCEGNTHSGPQYDATSQTTQDGNMIVERYFLRVDSDKPAGVPDKQAIVLACDAGSYTPQKTAIKQGDPSESTITNFGGSGSVLMQRVDHLRVNLGVQMTNGIAYLSIDKYKALATKPNIIAVQVAVLARANDSMTADQVPASQTFTLLDKTGQTIDDDSNKFIRRVYTQTIKLRNTGIVS